MANSKDIELRYYPQLADDTVVYSAIWQLVDPATKAPITNNPTQVQFVVNEGEKAKCTLAVGTGLTWNPTTKQVSIKVRNSDLTFVKADGQFQYALYVVWDHGQAQTIREGTVSAVRVA